MQAEAWRMQWSVAMQENEELRAKLYDTRNSLEAAGGGGASGEHWRGRAFYVLSRGCVRSMHLNTNGDN